MLFCKAFLGDLTPKGEKCGSEPNPKGEECLPNGREIWGEEKEEIIVLEGVQFDIGWR